MSGSIDVAVPGPGDADRMAAVHVQAWAETYSALLPARFYDEDVLARRRRMWRDILAVRQPRLRVARVGEVVVGFAFASDDVTAPAVRPLELHMLYVLSAFSGAGLGRALLEAVLGDDPAQLWVAERNDHAISFYRRNGFLPDGTRKVDHELNDLAELRLVR